MLARGVPPAKVDGYERGCRRACRSQPSMVSVRVLTRIGPYSVPGLYQFLLRVAERIAGKCRPKQRVVIEGLNGRGVKVSSD